MLVDEQGETLWLLPPLLVAEIKKDYGSYGTRIFCVENGDDLKKYEIYGDAGSLRVYRVTEKRIRRALGELDGIKVGDTVTDLFERGPLTIKGIYENGVYFVNENKFLYSREKLIAPLDSLVGRRDGFDFLPDREKPREYDPAGMDPLEFLKKSFETANDSFDIRKLLLPESEKEVTEFPVKCLSEFTTGPLLSDPSDYPPPNTFFFRKDVMFLQKIKDTTGNAEKIYFGIHTETYNNQANYSDFENNVLPKQVSVKLTGSSLIMNTFTHYRFHNRAEVVLKKKGDRYLIALRLIRDDLGYGLGTFCFTDKNAIGQ